ncbi:MAG: hypothetical protein HOW73_16330 [Polyangiaceae bacterium]|nr:hypothetical protein [Polyangiaceae bacterium]
MLLPRRALALLSLTAFIVACAPSAGPTDGTGRAAEVPTVPPPKGAAVQYLVLAPRAYADELQPLLDLRKSQGHLAKLEAVEDIYAARSGGKPTAEALADEIAEIAGSTTPQALKYVVLAGDPVGGPAPVPSFFSKIGDWIPDGFDAHPHRTDFDYSMFDKHTVAVGRLPARTEAEMTILVQKLLAYEAASSTGAWQRRVLVFGGPADFGPIADGALESQATTLLDELLPYDYDVGVIFAKADSPYVYRYDQLGTKIIHELNEGSLLAVYAGHGLEDSFDRARYRGHRYPIGSVKELEALNIVKGAPIFVSLTCLTGEYGRPSGERSLAETMILHPHGPVAVFAASDVSHPYPNLLYAQALLDSVILKRSPTIGDAIVLAKRGMLERSIPFASLLVPGDLDAIKKEHLTLYNLLGDPATRIRLPLAASVAMDKQTVSPGQKIALTINSKDVAEAPMVVTVETERSALKPGMVASRDIEAMPIEQAFEAMAKNYELASDKVLSKVEGKLAGGAGLLEVVAPSAPGRYIAKVLLQGDQGIASGHVRFEVRAGELSAR